MAAVCKGQLYACSGVGASRRCSLSRSAPALPLCRSSPMQSAPRLLCRIAPRSAASDDADTDMSGEWPVNWSLASYEDVGQFFQDNLFKDDASPGNQLSDLMSKDLTWTTPEARLDSITDFFDNVTGVPVVRSDTDKTLVGVLSKKDLQKGGAYVKDVMSTPPIAAKPTNKVVDAACLMLKHKVHRIPIVDNQAKLVGIVTRTDIFTALAMDSGNAEVLSSS